VGDRSVPDRGVVEEVMHHHDRPTLAALADQLLALHRPGDPLVLVNAWDAASARAVATAGAVAIGTSSAAVAASLGTVDDDRMDVDLAFEAVRRVAAATTLPVTADLEAGYRLSADELVGRLLAAGAVGCNLEDTDHHDRVGEQAAAEEFASRIGDVRAAADAVGVHVVLNARIDTLVLGGSGPEALDEIAVRAQQYLAAGADCVYPIRLADPAEVAVVVAATGGRVNANVAIGTPPSALAAAGAARISIGPQGHHRAMDHLAQLAAATLAR
jgi:2-methylisocitrate lyase-like PEP mutase family enzyme